MTNTTELAQLGEQGKREFAAARYQAAAEAFEAAARGYADLGDAINAAEQRNNLSVTLLQLDRLQDALDVAQGTDEVFGAAADVKRQGMALNNQAVALEKLKRADEALAAYERAADLLGEAGEGDLRAETLKAAAAIRLRRGQVTGSAHNMLGALGATTKPTLLERALKALLRLTR